MTVTFHSESWLDYFHDPDRARLWQEHWEEFAPVHGGKMPCQPDVETYLALASTGALEIVVARKAGRMIGYCLLVVRRHIHYSTLCGFEDSYYLDRSERGNGTGRALLKRSLEVFRARGCKRVYFMTKKFLPIGKLLESLGLEESDTVYSGWLGEP